MANDYTERQEGPDGQYCDLLTRVPYANQRMIEIGLSYARTNADRMDAALRGLLVGCSVLHELTRERSDDLNDAAAEVVVPWRVRAMDLYNAWYKQAFPGPKETSRTDQSTPPSGKKTPRSATGAPA